MDILLLCDSILHNKLLHHPLAFVSPTLIAKYHSNPFKMQLVVCAICQENPHAGTSFLVKIVWKAALEHRRTNRRQKGQKMPPCCVAPTGGPWPTVSVSSFDARQPHLPAKPNKTRESENNNLAPRRSTHHTSDLHSPQSTCSLQQCRLTTTVLRQKKVDLPRLVLGAPSYIVKTARTLSPSKKLQHEVRRAPTKCTSHGDNEDGDLKIVG